jgi:hypothetical protein
VKWNQTIAIGTLAAVAGVFVGMPPKTARGAAIGTWQGPSGTGDTGQWNIPGNWGSNTLPTSTIAVTIPSAENPTVTIGAGVAAATANFTANGGHSATLQLEDTGSLTGGSLLQVSGGTTLNVKGPASGTATVTYERLYLGSSTTVTNTVNFSGSSLTVDLTPGSYSNVPAGNVVNIIDGASVKIKTFYVQGTENSRLAIGNGTISGGALYAYTAGVVQLGAGGHMNDVAMGIGTSSNTGGRFEAEGSGMDSSSNITAYSGNTLAVGLTDTTTNTRTSAATFTLHSNAALYAGSHLEFGIFSAPGAAGIRNDLLALNGNSFTQNGSLLDIKTYGYTPQANQTYQLISGDTTGYTFNTSDINGTWAIFQNATGLYATAVPEPASLAVLEMGGLFLIRRRRR